jgi:hypothetical protein
MYEPNVLPDGIDGAVHETVTVELLEEDAIPDAVTAVGAGPLPYGAAAFVAAELTTPETVYVVDNT